MCNPTQEEKEHYSKLIGKKIVGIAWETCNGHTMPVLLLDCHDRNDEPAIVGVQADPEGNGPGYLQHNL